MDWPLLLRCWCVRVLDGYTVGVVADSVSLALGGGAAKGLAHVGVLRGLEEDGIEVAAIAGTSMGSIVGALHARGMGGAEMEAFFASS